MAETGQDRSSRQWLAQLRPLLPLLAAAVALLAVWMAWSGWQQLQDAQRRSEVTLARDMSVQQARTSLDGDRERLRERLSSAGMAEALEAGDLEAAGELLAADWRQLEEAKVYPADLELAYESLPEASFGRLAALEGALAVDQPVVWVIREGDQPWVALTAAAKVDDKPVGVAFVRLPISRVMAGVEVASIGPASYLGLRQGGHTLLERGNLKLAEAGERMAVVVPDTPLRVVAAVPHVGAAPFGLSGLPLFVVAALLLLLAYLVWRWLPTQLARSAGGGGDPELPTLAEALAAEPVPVVAVEAPRAPRVDIERGIFRAYDIRGIYGKTLDAGVAELIGHAVGSLMREQDLSDIVIGRDGRLSGPDLVNGLTQGLRKAGRNVIDIGVVPTPVTYFGAFHLRTGCCISLTGSHNPPDYNGFKIVVGGETLSGEAIVDLYARIAEDRLYTAPAPGGYSERDVSDDYVRRIADDVQLARPLKVVVDAGNGAAAEVGPRVLEAIGAEVIQLYCEIDGTFPNHHPDPSEAENLVDLIGTVQRFGADLGVAFDGDGDRLGVVTPDGESIFPDRLLMLFAADVLDRNPGAVIVYDVKCTGRLAGHILRHGGSPLMWKTGHSLIKAKMREVEAELAGEASGHFFFGERWYGFDDGIYAAARLLEILALDEAPADEVLKALPVGVSTPELKVDAPDGDPHAFVERFLEQARFEGGRLSTIDGLRVDWNDGWGLVRASNTTPVLVMRFDADSAEALARIQEEFRAQLLAIDPELALPF